MVNSLISPGTSVVSDNSLRTKKVEFHGLANASEKNFAEAAENFVLPASTFSILSDEIRNPNNGNNTQNLQPELIVHDTKKMLRVLKAPETDPDLMSEKLKSYLFLNSAMKDITHLILKYDGTGHSVRSIKAFCRLFPEKARSSRCTSLVSPVSFRKNQVLKEKQFVKKVTPLYGELGFIKLPLRSIQDFIDFAGRTQGNLIILPPSDLNNLIKHLTSAKFNKTCPVSFFVG